MIGVEKLTQFGGGTLPLSPEDREVKQGIVMPAVYAMRATRYLYETEATPEDLALVSVKARKHGALNPFAQYRKEVTVEEVLAARPVADPLTLLMCCPTGDGAAVVVLASDRARARLGARGMRIAASVLHSGQVAEGFRDMTAPEISAHSARDAYEIAGIGPKDLDMIELHDAFSIAELVYYETFGLAERGRGIDLIRDGRTTFGGDVVVNPSGGLLAKGHPGRRERRGADRRGLLAAHRCRRWPSDRRCPLGDDARHRRRHGRPRPRRLHDPPLRGGMSTAAPAAARRGARSSI